MKKVILTAQLTMKQDELKKAAKDLKRQWDDGFMLVPNHFKVQIVEGDWVAVEEGAPPEGEMVLTWIEYESDGNICQTYGFGRYDGDGWIVYLQQANKVLAWSSLPEPYKVRDG